MLRHFYNTLYLTKNEKRGYAILTLVLVLLFVFAKWGIPILTGPPIKLTQQELNEIQIKLAKTKETKPNFKLFQFNPNTVSLAELDSMGISKRVIQNLNRYRESGGFFYNPNDFKKLYGLADSVFQKVQPYLIFENTNDEDNMSGGLLADENLGAEKVEKSSFKEKKVPTFILNFSHISIDSLLDFGFSNFASQNLIKYYQRGGKVYSVQDLKSIYGIDSLFVNNNLDKFIFPKNEIHINFEINAASKEDLIKIPGIGNAYADRILKYREVLGGFCSFSQLNEVYGLENFDFKPYSNKIKLSPDSIKKYDLSQVEFNTLLKHPYFEYVDVKIIFDKLKSNPNISLEEILKDPLLSPKYKEKYKYYLQKSK